MLDELHYQDLFSRPLFKADSELTSDGPQLVAQERMAVSWDGNQENCDTHIFSTISHFATSFLFHILLSSWHLLT